MPGLDVAVPVSAQRVPHPRNQARGDVFPLADSLSRAVAQSGYLGRAAQCRDSAFGDSLDIHPIRLPPSSYRSKDFLTLRSGARADTLSLTMSKSELWQRLRAARRYADVTQGAIAKKLDLERSAVSQWEAVRPENRTHPSVAQLAVVSEMTGVPMWWLSDDDQHPESVWAAAKQPTPPVPKEQAVPLVAHTDHRAFADPDERVRSISTVKAAMMSVKSERQLIAEVCDELDMDLSVHRSEVPGVTGPDLIVGDKAVFFKRAKTAATVREAIYQAQLYHLTARSPATVVVILQGEPTEEDVAHAKLVGITLINERDPAEIARQLRA